MDDWAALRAGLELLHAPWRVRIVRGQPLPHGVVALLEVAAGEAAREAAAVKVLGRPHETVRHAAAFFIEQILLAPDADSYRVLGAGPAAPAGELRRNMALLMRWLHPDVACEGERSVFAARIAAAWNAVKTPERRTAYDTERRSVQASGSGRPEGASPGRPGSGRRSRRIKVRRRRPGGLPRILAYWLLGRPMHR